MQVQRDMKPEKFVRKVKETKCLPSTAARRLTNPSRYTEHFTKMARVQIMFLSLIILEEEHVISQCLFLQ